MSFKVNWRPAGLEGSSLCHSNLGRNRSNLGRSRSNPGRSRFNLGRNRSNPGRNLVVVSFESR